MNKRQQELHRKRLAYSRTFRGDGETLHEDGQRVLADLKRFCRINRGGIVVSPVNRQTDPYATIYQAGLRDAYLRIIGFLQLDETDVHEESNHEPTSTDLSAS